MFKNMKALPKALILAVVVAIPIATYMKFKPAPTPQVEVVKSVEATPVGTFSAPPVVDVKREPLVEDSPSTSNAPNVTNGDAGMKALLTKGRK